MSNFLTAYFILICIVNVSNSQQVKDIILRQSKCFESYKPEVTVLNTNYENFYRACYNKDNINRLPPPEIDAQAELDKFIQIANEACSNLAACGDKTDLIAALVCYAKTSGENIDTFNAIYLDASSTALELNNQISKEDKEVLRCQQIAKREYLMGLAVVNKKLLICLKRRNDSS